LRHLTPSQNENESVLTLSRADEKSIPTHVLAKRSKEKIVVQEKLFPEARNFK